MPSVRNRSLAALARVLDERRRDFEYAGVLPLEVQRAIVWRALEEVPLAAADAVRAGAANPARALIARQPSETSWVLAGVPWSDVLSSALAETS